MYLAPGRATRTPDEDRMRPQGPSRTVSAADDTVAPMDHYFSASPGATSAPRLISADCGAGTLVLETDNGVFAHRGLDPGTLVLLRAVSDVSGREVLDLGTGYGPIAITAARRRPAARVWAVDVN